MGGSSDNNWDPRNSSVGKFLGDPMKSSLGSYANRQYGSGPKIDINPMDSTPGKALGSTGSAILHASQGNFNQAGQDLGDAANASLQTGLGQLGATYAPTAAGMLQNESDRNKLPDAERKAQEDARIAQEGVVRQQAGQAQQAQQAQVAQDAQQAENRSAFDQQNSLENALRNAYQQKRKNAAPSGY